MSRCPLVTNNSLQNLAQKTHQLTHLDLNHCSQITGEGVEGSENSLSNLTYLNLSFCPITDKGLSALLRCAPQVKNLDLIFCKQLTNICLAQELSKLSLEKLNVSCCAVEDSFFTSPFPSLKTLRVASCKITDYAFFHLFSNLPHLQCLDIGGCTQLTSLSISKAASLPQLEKLNISFTKISSRCLQHLSRMSNLQELDIRHMRGEFSPEDLDHLISNSKSLKRLILEEQQDLKAIVNEEAFKKAFERQIKIERIN